MKCSISECKNKATQLIRISFKEKRNLCEYHYNLFKNKEKKHKTVFTKASKFNKTSFS